MKLKQRPNKVKLKKFIELNSTINIDDSNFNVSTINSNGIYSVEPNLDCIREDWFLVLINTSIKSIFIFIVPQNNLVYNKLYERGDKGRFRLLFEINDKAFREQNSYERFNKFLRKEFKYINDEIIF